MRERGLDLVWSRCGVWGEGEGGSKDEGRSLTVQGGKLREQG